MSTVFLAGSRKFSDALERIFGELESSGFSVLKGRDSLEEKDMEREKAVMLRRIDVSDVVYVVCPGGYVGETVRMEIRYAHSKGKKIFSSGKIEQRESYDLVSAVVPEEEIAVHLHGLEK